MIRYLIIIEKAEHNFSAYVPDLPGCVATGASREEVVTNMREAIAFHLEGMLADGEPIPTPNTDPEFIEVDVPTSVA